MVPQVAEDQTVIIKIKNNIVNVYTDLNFNTFLCKFLNWHKWEYFRMARSWESAFLISNLMNRRCMHCGAIQCTDDGKEWKGRL